METTEILADLERACFPDDFWTAESIRTTLLRSDVIHLMEYGADGSPAAYCIGAAAYGEAELYRIGVLPEQRRKGMGKRILTDFISACPKDTEKIFLEVRESNIPAIELYKSCGFKPEAVRKNYYGGGENAVIMVFNVGERPAADSV